ncbi:tyrosine-type recombinase/integrase [Qipengyuania nanhaisediminis]|uniref:tyrosine-type recombinase/integrase n=1 Tax=Qipengyuania nanhaisediminis TaxID=604088 RepID=UPI0015A650E3|nr:tyrosine-type recombinase/integrase [Qipengyuania nanhaisediminis]
MTAFSYRHGKIRYRYRRKGRQGGYFSSSPGSEEFRAEYHAFENKSSSRQDAQIQRPRRGTIGDLKHRYMSVPDRLGPTKVTQQKVGAVIEDFCKGREGRLVSQLTFEHLDAIIAKKKTKTVRDTPSGPREVGGYFAAKKLRKELIRFFQFAKKAGFCDHNVAKDTSPVQRGRGEASGGFHAWTEGQIAQFQRHWPLGTRERAALELLLWTDQRRSDIVKMGMAQTRDGCLPIIQAKTGTKLWLPMADQLVEAIVALPPEFSDPSCFLITHKGKPFTKESFGNWFAKACDQAGLPSKCRAHGLRKATLRRMAELGMSNKEMKSVSGQKRDATLALYIESADQRALATNAIRRLSAWASEAECLTSSRKLDMGNAEDG